MPNPRSLYAKLHTVLEIARAAKSESLEDLIDGIRDPVFHTKQYIKERDEFGDRRSERVVRRIVAMCRMLDLLDSSGALTDKGRHALRRGAFDDVLRSQVNATLDAAGVSVDRLNTLVRRALRQEPPALPTARYLWEVCETDMPAGQFGRLLNLLSATAGAEASQRRVFTHFRA